MRRAVPPLRREGRALMLRLGLRLTLHSGREALVRLLITAAAVAVGVALLLGVLAEFHAFQSNANKACWSCTPGRSRAGHAAGARRAVEQQRGLLPGPDDQPARRRRARPGRAGAARRHAAARAAATYYASPALAALLAAVPAGQLGDRFPGTLVGTIGQAGAAPAPSDLVIYIGYTPAHAQQRPRHPVGHLDLHRRRAAGVHPVLQGTRSTSACSRVLFPMLVLISTATRLAADRREERFAALRLVGGTPARHPGHRDGRGRARARSSARCSAPASSCWSGRCSPAPRSSARSTSSRT